MFLKINLDAVLKEHSVEYSVTWGGLASAVQVSFRLSPSFPCTGSWTIQSFHSMFHFVSPNLAFLTWVMVSSGLYLTMRRMVVLTGQVAGSSGQ